MRGMLLLFVLILSSCTTEADPPVITNLTLQDKEYETVKHIILADGREFTIMKMLNVEQQTTDFSSSSPFGNKVITVHSDPYYRLEHNGVLYDEHAVPYLVDYDLRVLDRFEINYEVEHIFKFENGNDGLYVNGTEKFLDFVVERKLITSDGDEIVYERLVFEDLMVFIDLAIEIVEEVESEILDSYGEVIGVRVETTIRGLHDYDPMIKVTVNGHSAHGLGIFSFPELTSERLDLLGIGHNWIVRIEEIYY